MEDKILYSDNDVAVVIKPRGALSEDAEGGVPRLLAEKLGRLYPVHRLDRGVGGVMVYARHARAAAALSRAVAEGALEKEYTAVCVGLPDPEEGEWQDLLYHDKRVNKTFVVDRARAGARDARLAYRVTDRKTAEGVLLSRVTVRLFTGRSHQIRVQFASRRHPLVGDGKYGSRIKAPYPALYATSLCFPHPKSGKRMEFSAPTPNEAPWSLFADAHFEIERKLLIAYPDVMVLCAADGVEVLSITQTYLTAPAGVTLRVRAVTKGDSTRYIKTAKRRVNALRAVEEEEELTGEAYQALLEKADPALRPIRKTRYRIPYAGHTVEVDLFDFWQDRALCEVELADESEPFVLPPYLRVLSDVSADARYKNVNLARKLPEE